MKIAIKPAIKEVIGKIRTKSKFCNDVNVGNASATFPIKDLRNNSNQQVIAIHILLDEAISEEPREGKWLR